MKAMILCAGLGTRFRPHTEKLAKPAIPFMGVPMAGYSIYYLEKLGLTDLTVNTHHLPETVEAAVSCLTNDQNYTVTFLNENPILGSGGGLKNAKEHLQGDEPFVVINGDEVAFHANKEFLKDMLEEHKKNDALLTMLTMPHPDAGKKFAAVEVNDKNEITAIGIKGDNKNYVHNCGFYVYSPRIFDYMPEKSNFSIFTDCVIPAMNREEKVMSFEAPKDMLWLDMSGESEYLEATEMTVNLLQEPGPTAETLKDMLNRFHQGIETQKTEDAFIVLAKDAKLDDTSNAKGFVVLGAGSTFKNGTLENAVIAPNVHIHEMVSLKNQLVLG